MFQGFLEFLEQPNVFDSDDCLIRESFKKSNLFVRKRSNFGPAKLNGADRDSFAKQWHNKSSAGAGDPLTGFGFRVLAIEQRQNVINVNRLALDNGSAGGCASTERPAALRHWHRSVRRHMLKKVAIDPID